MEGEANLQAPSTTSSPVFVDRSSSSSSSSSFSSPSRILRNVQAAFKRHRPLVAMQSNSIKPRRILVPQREACRNSLELPPSNTVDEIPSSVLCPPDVATAMDECPDLSDSQKPVLNTVKRIPENHLMSSRRDCPDALAVDFAEDNFAKEKVALQSNSIKPRRILVPQREACRNSLELPPPNTVDEIPSSVPCPPDVATALDECPDSSDSQKPVLDTVKRIPENHIVSSRRDCRDASTVNFAGDNLATEKARDCVETYGDAGAPESSFYIKNPKSGVYSRPTNRAVQHHIKNPTQSTSAVGLSSATATSLVNSFSAPAAISTTDCSLSRKYGEAISAPGLRNSAPDPSRKEPKQEKGEGNRGKKKNYNTDMFFKVNGKLYQKLGKIGSGGSSEVHKVASSDCSIYALKKIKLKGRDYGTAYGFCQEIEYLNRLKGKEHIIQLIDYEVTDKALLQELVKGTTNTKENKVKDDSYIYMVLEYGEIDLAHMISKKRKKLSESDREIDENWLRYYWEQILLAVDTIHEERIVHSDLKPANFLLVQGSLKLIDFGIAKAIMNDTTNIQRDSQVGTLSYMSPEAFMCNERDEKGRVIKCGRASDIWSLGCILYQMVYGRTPFSEYKTFWAKFKVITDRNYRIVYGPIRNTSLLEVMHTCLTWDSHLRSRIPDLLRHNFILNSSKSPPSESSTVDSQLTPRFSSLSSTDGNN